MTQRPKRIPRTLAALLVGATLAVATPRPAEAADPFWGEQDIALGDRVSSVLAGTADEVHLFSFYGTKGSRLEAQVVAERGASLAPGLRLARPGGTEVSVGRRLRTTGARAAISSFTLPYSGWFVLEVTARSGAGAYTLTTRGHFATGLRGVVPHASGEQVYRFHASAGTRLSAVLSPRRGRARPQITGLLDPTGDVVPVLPSRSGAKSSIRNVVLDADGEYRLLWTNDGPVGDVNVRFSFGVPSGPTFDRVLPASLGRPQSRIDTGAPRADALPGYVGSAACGRCHDDTFRTWSKTAHNLAVRPWNQPGLAGKAFTNDVNKNGKDDFRDGLDLASQPAFVAYGANAPRLS